MKLNEDQIMYLKAAHSRNIPLKKVTKVLYEQGARNSKGNLRANDISGYCIKKLGLRRIPYMKKGYTPRSVKQIEPKFVEPIGLKKTEDVFIKINSRDLMKLLSHYYGQ